MSRLRPLGLLAALLPVILVCGPPASLAADPASTRIAIGAPGGTPVSATDDPVPESWLELAEITAVTEAGEVATIRGTVTNTSGSALPAGDISVLAAPEGSDPSLWATTDETVTGSALATDQLPALPVGESAAFVVQVEASDLLPGRPWGTAPISLQVDGLDSAVHTFLGVHRAKEYEPLQVLWGIPVTLEMDRRLVSASPERRATAWEQAAGPGSRLDDLTRSAPASDEMWLIDPTVIETLSPSEPDDPAPEEPDVPAGGAIAATAEEIATRDALSEQITSNLDPASTLVLPQADADLAALGDAPAARRLIAGQVEAGERLSGVLRAGSAAWPADGLLTSGRAADWAELYGQQPTTIVGSHTLPTSSTRVAPAQTVDGSQLLVADDDLARAVGGASDPSSGLLARQEVLAETSEILLEYPGTSRSVLALPPRSAMVDPQAYAELRDAIREVPWLEPTTLGETVQAAADSEPVILPDTIEDALAAPDPTDPDPTSAIVAAAGDTALTDGRAQRVDDDRDALRTFSAVRADGDPWAGTLDPLLTQLTSARWRGHPWAWIAAEEELAAEATLSADELTVPAADVNFFADSGRLQITVENRSDVELRNLSVRLVPQTPILRIDEQADPLTIGPGSSQQVSVQASALAAGNVPIDIEVLAPDGSQLASHSTLEARVRPTGNWIYWALGGLAGLLVGLGVWRSLRSHD